MEIKKHKLNLVVMLAAVLVCLSAVMVSLVSADGGASEPVLNTTWEQTDLDVTLAQYPGTAYTVDFENMEAGVYMVETIGTQSDGSVRFGALAGWDANLSWFKKCVSVSKTEYVNTLWIRLPEGNSSVSFYGNGHKITAMRLTKTDDLPTDDTFFYNPNRDLFQAWKAANGLTSSHWGGPGLLAVKQADDSYLYFPATDGNITTYTAGTGMTAAEIASDPKWANSYIRYSATSKGATGFVQTPVTAKIYSGGRQASVLVRGGDTMRFVLTAPKAGKFAIWAPIGVNDPTTVTIHNLTNSKATAGIKVTQDNNGDSWQYANRYICLGELELAEGANQIELTAAGGTFANIGELAFTHAHTFGTTYEKDASAHWQICTVCTKAGEKVAHTGGSANYTDKAKCEICQAEYGAVLQNEVSFKTADAVEGKITLPFMAPGIYEVSVKGKIIDGVTDKNRNFGFQVLETQEGFAVRTKTLNSPDAYVKAFAARLVEGTNTLSIYNQTAASLEITEYKLTKIQELPLAAEEMSAGTNIFADAAANVYAKVNCAIAEHTGCTGVHYYKATTVEGRKWTYKADGVADTDYFLSIDKLPANAHIRDCTAGLVIQKDDGGNILYDDTTKKALTRVATEKDGEANFGPAYKTDANATGGFDVKQWNNNSYGKNYCTGNGSVTGSIFVRSMADVKITVTAPKAGTYRLYSAFNMDASAKLSISVGGGEAADATITKTKLVAAPIDSGSGNQGTYYGDFGTVTLAQGENVILLSVMTQWINFSGITLVHEHDYEVKSDATQHWNQCKDCGATDTKVNHTTPADDGSCTTAIVCPDCQYVLVAAKTHTGGTATCTAKAVCTNTGCTQAYGELAPHAGGTATCTAKAKCAACQAEYGELAEHEFTVAQKDATQHWSKCASCDAIDTKVDHAGGTATCTAKAICATCQAEYGELLAHAGGTATCTAKAKCAACQAEYGELDPANHAKDSYTYVVNEDGTHTKKHECCGVVAEENATHVYGEDKKCACGAEKTGCGASIAASAVAVTAILGLGIGFIRKKKED